jgi:multidrug efflux pump subunit AcrA (membrane-fusion protein)
LIAATVTGCDKPVPPISQARPVRTVAVERGAEGETVSLTGQVRAKDEVSLAFRLNGRMIERPANVGDVLKAGQVVARLDPQIEQNGLDTARANLWLEVTRRPGPLRWPRSAIQILQPWSRHGAAFATATPSYCRASRSAFAILRSAVSNPSVKRS